MKCKICNRECKNFISVGSHIKDHKLSAKEYYDKFVKEDEGICPECGKETNFIGLNGGYRKYCSYKCSRNSREVKEKYEETCIEKYGVKNPFQNEEVKEKIKESNLIKYGVENSSQNEEIKENKRQTCLKKYGVKYPFQHEEIQKKYKQTCLEKYGVEYYTQTQEFQEKCRQTYLEKYGVRHYTQTQEYKERLLNGQASYMNSFIKNPSKPQVELYNLVKSLNEDAVLNFQVKEVNKSIDIAIPSLMIAIEYDGSY